MILSLSVLKENIGNLLKRILKKQWRNIYRHENFANINKWFIEVLSNFIGFDCTKNTSSLLDNLQLSMLYAICQSTFTSTFLIFIKRNSDDRFDA